MITKNTLFEKNKIDLVRPFKVGEIVEGIVVGIGRSAVYLDLGPRGTGIIYGREYLEEKDVLKGVKLGEKILSKIIELENEEGYIELSLKEAGRELTWSQLKELQEKQEIIKVKIIGANKGGLLAELRGVQAFLPVSQLSQTHYPRVENGDTLKILRELQKFMGKELDVQIFDLDPREEKIILSERSKERNKIKEMLANYKVGDVVEGEITGVVDFGAFMKFPTKENGDSKDALEAGQGPQQVEGLIHISEIDWQIIEDPSRFLKVGDRVKAKIIDLAQGRASLSLKVLKEDPWKEAEKKYKKFDEIQGKVTKLNPFGAFVEIESKIQGLCHISEFGLKKNMEEHLNIGTTYAFQIIEFNPTEHRMSLRLTPQKSSAESPSLPPEKEEQTPPAKEE
ncbi:MAG: S1 RNA-binding domain-containing protein [Patescibacteria group bacterium]